MLNNYNNSNKFNSVTVLKIKLYPSGIKNAAKFLLENCNGNSKPNNLVSATGAHGIICAQIDSKFKTVLNSFQINLPDGMPGVWIGRLKGNKRIQRCYGPDFFAEVMKYSANRDVKHFFCGGKPGVAEQLKKAVRSKFHNNN